MLPEFEKAIQKALDKAPHPLLEDTNLDYFKYLVDDLRGGLNFKNAFRTIKSYADNPTDSRSKVAQLILNTIELKIASKIQHAAQISSTQPLKAYAIYTDLVTRYDGIEAIIPAKLAGIELKKTLITKNLLDPKNSF